MQLRAQTLSCLAVAFWLGVAPVSAAPPTAAEGALVARALDAAAGGDWRRAGAYARLSGSVVAADIVLWTRLRDGAGEWREYLRFLDAHPDWPGQQALRRSAERRMPAALPPADVLAFFEDRTPLTGTGALRLSEALAMSGREAEAETEIVRVWRDYSMSGTERRAVLDRWRGTVAPYNAARLDMLLWRGLTGEAEAMLPLVDEDWQKLAQARIATRRDDAGLQYLINTVPGRLKSDPGLAYERYLYRVGKGRWQEAEDYLLEQSRSAQTLGRPEMWMDRRANLARQALEDGDVDGAYRLASRSFGAEGADYADSEWVAGYIALTRLDEPARAVEHFLHFDALVRTPISRGRSGYWLGLAYERLGDVELARAAWAEGAEHQTSFYGQLAAEKLGGIADPGLAGTAVPPEWRDTALMDSEVVQAAYLLHVAGDKPRASQFLRHAAEGAPPATRAALAQMAIDLGRPEIGIRIAKDAAGEGIVLPEQYYPLHSIAHSDWPVPTEYAMAIARQESELDATAASGAGARGLMQVMPATAQRMAEVTGQHFDATRLTEDPQYNASLGTAYLAQMLERYAGNYVLATAAYNAGPGRVDEWLERFGDPRDPESTDAVLWIESIPFSETRNYVMRVLEGLHVYRARLKGAAEPVRLVADITRTG